MAVWAVLLGAALLLVGLVYQRRQRAHTAGLALLDATEAGDLQAMQQLLAQGATVNARNAQGWTPLHVAAMGGDLQVLTLLLTHGADVHAQSYSGFTPLHSVSMRGGSRAVVDLLIAHGAVPDTAADPP